MKQGADDARREQDQNHDRQHVNRGGAVRPDIARGEDGQGADEEQGDGEDGEAHAVSRPGSEV